ncbi:hypothetical protein Hanom_Chr11g01049211 [Helianthus anomalus]
MKALMFYLFWCCDGCQDWIVKDRVGYIWGTEGIRVLKAVRVVILLNPWPVSSVYPFLAGFGSFLLGNLNLFFCFVVSLFGALTILAASVVFKGVLVFLY